MSIAGFGRADVYSVMLCAPYQVGLCFESHSPAFEIGTRRQKAIPAKRNGLVSALVRQRQGSFWQSARESEFAAPGK